MGELTERDWAYIRKMRLIKFLSFGLIKMIVRREKVDNPVSIYLYLRSVGWYGNPVV